MYYYNLLLGTEDVVFSFTLSNAFLMREYSCDEISLLDIIKSTIWSSSSTCCNIFSLRDSTAEEIFSTASTSDLSLLPSRKNPLLIIIIYLYNIKLPWLTVIVSIMSFTLILFIRGVPKHWESNTSHTLSSILWTTIWENFFKSGWHPDLK